MCPSLIGLVSLIGSISVVEAFTPLVKQSPVSAHDVLPLLPSPVIHAFHQRASVLRSSTDGRKCLHLSSSTTTTGADTPGAVTASSSEPPILGGVQEFDTWFQSKSVGGKSQPELRHATFQSNTLRGLQYDGGKDRGIVEVPEKVVLRTEYNRNTKDGSVDENWDARLAVMLVKECLKGEGSDVFGYCSLLARGVPFNSVAVPPPTAPDAVRHWTSQQKARLKASSKGERLLRKVKSQLKSWSDKYADLPAEDRSQVTEEQFVWAMEAVNSRAFKGNYGGGLLNQLQRLTIPIVAAAFGAIVLISQPGDETADLIAEICGLLVLGPALISMIDEGSVGPGKADAVLLPYIDSANHSDHAESNIEYDPVNGIFILDVGRNCKVPEDDGRTQLYINYGRRTDSDLLLNYGFLTNMEGGTESVDVDQRRARLAKEFVKRNP